MNKIVAIEGKCAVGKTTWLVEHGIIEPEFADFHIDEATYNKDLGMISFEDQLKFVHYKIKEFKEKSEELQSFPENIYMDRQVLSPVAFGAGYYKWYELPEEEINKYLDRCYDLIDKNLPEGWQDKLEVLVLVPENEEDLRIRILSRGREFETSHIDDILKVNDYYMDFLLMLLDKYKVKYTKQIVTQRN